MVLAWLQENGCIQQWPLAHSHLIWKILRSRTISVYGAEGNSVRHGCSCWTGLGVDTWHGIQIWTISFTLILMPENHTFFLIICFVLMIPCCVVCDVNYSLFIADGATEWWSQRTTLSVIDSSSFNWMKLDKWTLTTRGLDYWHSLLKLGILLCCDSDF